MIYVHADDQDDPHSDILVQIKGTGNLIVHEAGTLLNYIYEQDSDMFHHIVQSVLYIHKEDFSKFCEDPDDE